MLRLPLKEFPGLTKRKELGEMLVKGGFLTTVRLGGASDELQQLRAQSSTGCG